MIKKAVVPIAGQGTGLVSVTSIVPKAMFPLVAGQGNIKTVLQAILERVNRLGLMML